MYIGYLLGFKLGISMFTRLGTDVVFSSRSDIKWRGPFLSFMSHIGTYPKQQGRYGARPYNHTTREHGTNQQSFYITIYVITSHFHENFPGI